MVHFLGLLNNKSELIQFLYLEADFKAFFLSKNLFRQDEKGLW